MRPCIPHVGSTPTFLYLTRMKTLYIINNQFYRSVALFIVYAINRKRVWVFDHVISNSLIIHEENTKEINFHLNFLFKYWFVWDARSNTRKSVSSGYPNTSKLLKNSAYGLVFQHTSWGLDILIKHSSSCSIYYMKQVHQTILKNINKIKG